jgi:hypothetical protein
MNPKLLGLLTILAVATSCSATPLATASTLPSTTAPSTTSGSSKPTPVSTTRDRYAPKELFELRITPSATAASTSEVYVAEVALRARATGVLSKVVVISASGGAPKRDEIERSGLATSSRTN